MAKEIKNWRVIDVLKWAKKFLKEKGSESPQIETEWILREVLNCSRLDLYMEHEKPLSNSELAQIRKYLKRRAAGEPIQYILGYTEFYGLRFNVDSSVLIPRPETEMIIEKLLNIFSVKDEISILDIGTGSGNIIITLIKKLDNATGYAIDISTDALKIAQKNSILHSVQDKIEFKKMDILINKPSGEFDLIISNPPYISKEQFEELPRHIKEHEPVNALKTDSDALSFYRRIREIAPELLKEDGMLALEIGGSYQEEPVRKIFENTFNQIEVVTDYLGESRGLLINSQDR